MNSIQSLRELTGSSIATCKKALAMYPDDLQRAARYVKYHNLAVRIVPGPNETADQARERWLRNLCENED